MSDNSSRRDPGSPIARLTEAEKQIDLAIGRLESEIEHVDPHDLHQLEYALETVQGVANSLDDHAHNQHEVNE